MYHCAEMSTVLQNTTLFTNVSEVSVLRTFWKVKSSRSSDVFLMSANAITRSNLFYDPLQDVLHDLLHDLLQKSILGRHSLNAHPLIGRIQIQYDFASTNHHRYQLPSKNVFRENARSGLPIVSRAESDENLKFDRVMHKTQAGKTMLPSRSSVPGP